MDPSRSSSNARPLVPSAAEAWPRGRPFSSTRLSSPPDSSRRFERTLRAAEAKQDTGEIEAHAAAVGVGRGESR